MLSMVMMMFFLIHLIFLDFIWVIYILVLSLMVLFMSFMNFFNLILIKNFIFLEDKISYLLIYLTIWIFLLSMISSIKILDSNYSSKFLLTLLILMNILVMNFLTSKMFLFFFFFECSLIPTTYLILGWGMKIERIQSGFYMLFYTLFGSLPMMLGISKLMNLNFSSSFILMEEEMSEFFLVLSIYLPFLMKIPMFLFHSWLPKAHVEAPVSGSMILAGILLKLGGYGILRFNLVILKLNKLSTLFFCVSVIGGILGGMICLRQVDLKSLVAYSSVSHMSLIISSLFSYLNLGMFGSLMMMISHGFCSSCLFSLINFNYERIHSRLIIFNKGMMSVMPSLTFWWFMFCSLNMACPPSLNLFSEILMLSSIFMFSKLTLFFLFLMPFISAVYNLFLFSFSQHGKFLNSLNMMENCLVNELMICMLHFVPLFFSFLKIEFFN